MNRIQCSRNARMVVVILVAVLLTLMTVALQVRALGFPYLGGEQLARHQAVINGTTIDPWQYRVLSDFIVEVALRFLARIGVPHGAALAFLITRLLQNAAIFLLAAAYYRKLGLGPGPVLWGLIALGWGMTHATFNSDLQFSTYTDIIFYLTAALALDCRSWWPYLGIAAGAALNRETSLLIPFMLPADSYTRRDGEKSRPRRALFAVMLLLSIGIILGLRWAYGPRPPGTSTPPIGLPMLLYNLPRPQTYLFLFATLGPLPPMALWFYRRWPDRLRGIFWAVVPAWCVVHILASVVAEARLFLVPQALVFIPGALTGLCPEQGGTGLSNGSLSRSSPEPRPDR